MSGTLTILRYLIPVDGTSDDLDLPIKACFLDNEFVKAHNLTSINSINWARIMIQIVHYFYSYFQVYENLFITLVLHYETYRLLMPHVK